MPRLQVLQLPEGASDERPPFVLVIDQAPRDQALFRSFREDMELNDNVAGRVGARTVLVFEDTVEIPANEVPLGPDGYPVQLRVEADLDGFREQVAGALDPVRGEVDRMDQITDALGLDRLRDWDEIVSAIKRQRRIAAEGGHEFGGPGFNDPIRCSRCGIERSEWVTRRDVPTCVAVWSEKAKGGE